MREYGKTFRRRWYLYCLPPLLLALVLGFVAASKPKTYESSASLWVDNGPTSGSSLISTSETGPSTFQQTLLNELLATDSFDLAVGEASGLKNSVVGATAAAKRSAIVAAVKNGTGVTTAGPQVLQLTFTGSSAEVAQSALSAVITNLRTSTTKHGQAFGRSSVIYYASQLQTAQKAQRAARKALKNYRANHPNSTATSSSTYAALSSAVSTANVQVTDAEQSLNGAQAQAKVGVVGTTVSVVDSPSLPTGPSSGKKKAVELAAAGLVGGSLLSLLLVVALTKSEDDRWESEMRALPGSPTSPTARGLVIWNPSGGDRGLTARSGVEAERRQLEDEHDAEPDADEEEGFGPDAQPPDQPLTRKRGFGRSRDARETA